MLMSVTSHGYDSDVNGTNLINIRQNFSRTYRLINLRLNEFITVNEKYEMFSFRNRTDWCLFGSVHQLCL